MTAVLFVLFFVQKYVSEHQLSIHSITLSPTGSPLRLARGYSKSLSGVTSDTGKPLNNEEEDLGELFLYILLIILHSPGMIVGAITGWLI